MERFDVVVAGAGPAGATAALAAVRGGARVLLLDAAAFPRDKVCGDGIAPQALDVLAELGVDVAALTGGTAPAQRLRLRSPRGHVAVRDFARPTSIVPRVEFDARLVASAQEQGVDLRHHRVRQLVQDAGGVTVDDRFRAEVLIGADGAESTVRRAAGFAAPRAGTTAVALRGYHCGDEWPAGEQLLTMTRAGWPAYAWAFPVGDGRVNVGYGQLTRHRSVSRAHLMAELTRLLPGVRPDEVRGHRLPMTPGRPVFARGRVLLAGDAASLINPLTGEGIYYAVRSGQLAGGAATGPRPADDYRFAVTAALGRHLRQTDVLSVLFRAPVLVDASVRATARSQRVFDEVVDTGLADGRVSGRGLAAIALGFVGGRPRTVTSG